MEELTEERCVGVAEVRAGLETESPFAIRRIASGDERRLMEFYNSLSDASKRLFKPLGLSTDVDACSRVVRSNRPVRSETYDVVAMDGNCVAGWAFLWRIKTEEPHLGIAVADGYRGKGLGGRLMRVLMDEARRRRKRKVSLIVVQDNRRAVALYERFGFRISGERMGNDGLPYFCMEAALAPEMAAGSGGDPVQGPTCGENRDDR